MESQKNGVHALTPACHESPLHSFCATTRNRKAVSSLLSWEPNKRTSILGVKIVYCLGCSSVLHILLGIFLLFLVDTFYLYIGKMLLVPLKKKRIMLLVILKKSNYSPLFNTSILFMFSMFPILVTTKGLLHSAASSPLPHPRSAASLAARGVGTCLFSFYFP